MLRTKKTAGIAAAILAALIVGGSAAGIAATRAMDDDGDTPITGPALERASQAALEYTGGGRVTGTEVGDEESLYEVEVTRDDGSQIDVQLDENFHVVGDKVDREDPDTNDAQSNDN